MKVAILISSLTEGEEYAPVIASVNAVQEQTASWEYVAIVFVEESKRLITLNKGSSSMCNQDRAYLARTSQKVNGQQQGFIRRKNTMTRCYNCNKPVQVDCE